MSLQLPLHIGLRDSATFANFLPDGNDQAIASLNDALAGRGERFIFLWGKRGTGKTHLLQAACHTLAAQGRQAAYLPLSMPGLQPAMLEGLENMAFIAIDDIHAVAGQRDWETALFNLYNRVREESQACLVVTANAHPQSLAFVLPDLASRLVWGLVYGLQSLDDAALAKAMQLRASGRGMELPDEVVAFILKRCPRDMPSLFGLLEKLDRESLAAQRKLTIPFVKQFID
ncbi:MAG: DnaA regulatory inactivator Hda [Granulosicoccaceae bacterium]|jgi:DnaA family protein